MTEHTSGDGASSPLPPPPQGSAVGGQLPAPDSSGLAAASPAPTSSPVSEEGAGRSRRPWGVIAVGIVAAAVLVVGAIVAIVSGADSDDAFSLTAAADNARDATTVEYDITMLVGDEAALTMGASVDTDDDVVAMRIDAGAVLGDELGDDLGGLELDVVIDGANGVLYVASGDLLDSVGGGLFGIDATWVAMDLDMLGGLTGDDELVAGITDQLGANPLALADSLGDLDGDQVEEVGAETIDGTETVRYRIPIDVSESLPDLPSASSLLEELGELMGVPVDESLGEDLDDLLSDELGVDDLSYDVWVTEDNQIRRIAVEISAAGEPVTVVIDAYNVGEPLEQGIPDPDDVFDLGGLFGD